MRLTRDEPASGVAIFQPVRGFRYGAEAFWLAGFALEGGTARTAVDLGTGSGVVALLLASQGLDVTGVDHRPEWSACWERTLAASAVRASLVQADLAGGLDGRFDLAVSNPPFFQGGAGPLASDPWKAAARTESTAPLRRFLDVAVDLAPRACVVLPVERQREAEAHLGMAGRRVRVGRRRVLLEWGGLGREDGALAEDHPRVRGWYAVFRSGMGGVP